MIFTCLPSGPDSGWGVCGDSVNRALAQLRLIALVPPCCPPGRVDGPLLAAMFPHTHEPGPRHLRGTRNVGYTFFERNREAMRNIANAHRWWDWVAAGSTWCEGWLREAGFERCSTAVQGVDHALFHPAAEVRESPGFTVFSGGCFQYRKAQDVVIAAMRVLMERHPDVRLSASWETPAPQEDYRATMAASRLIDPGGDSLGELCARNGLDMRRVEVHPAAPHARMAARYLASDAGLFPNRCEGGTNLVLMEYMACGRPAIAAAATGQADVLTPDNSIALATRPLRIDGQADWVEPELEDVIAQLEWAYRNRGELRAVAVRGARDMLAWTWKRTAAALLAALEAA